MRNKYPCKSEFVEMSTYKSCWSWSVSQFSTCMTLLRHVCERNSFWKADWQSNVHFPCPNELTICPEINGFQRALKTSFIGHRWRKAKDFFVFCSWKICLELFEGCCSFVLRHLCPVHKINAQTPITTILVTHLLHEFIVNVKHRMDWSYRKPYVYICLSFNSCWCNMFNFGEYAEICHLPLTSLKESNFPWLKLKFPDLINCPLRVK